MTCKIDILSNTNALYSKPTADLQSALGSSSAEEVISLLKSSKETNHPLPNGEMPLHYAIRKRDPAFIEKLLNEISFDYNLKDHRGFTPIEHAQITHDPKMISLILSHKLGANFNSAQTKVLSPKQIQLIEALAQNGEALRSRQSNLPLHQAAAAGDLEKLKSLFDPKKGDTTDSLGMTPLHYAALNGKVEAVDWLLKQGSQSNLLTPQKESLLHFAVAGRNEQIVAKILEMGKVDPNSVDVRGRTPLHYAMTDNNLNLSQALIKAGADPSWHSGELTESVSPLEAMFHLAKTRGNRQDSLQLSKIQQSFAFGIACSWASYFAGGVQILDLLSFLSKIECFYYIFTSLKTLDQKLGASLLLMYSFIPGFNVIYRLWNTYMIGTRSIQGIKACWDNRFFERYRPLRNVAIHTVTGISLAQELKEDVQSATSSFNYIRQLYDETIKNHKPIDPNFCENLSEMDCILKEELDPSRPRDAKFILRLPEKFKQEDCSKAFRKLSLHLHPDKNQNNSENAHAAFLKVSTSAETLGCGR